eukprot:CAMPEP_0172829416 /NCGR_PEP_ID=MMETSP1075-20121228/21536_1 /TAXON_ID=2916 /ORGANISM="Ceratium fusus, Strain PA161109" /LENGTH=45 /DNA_ID= /DNA_START= /DNA_END= /DNA_ORIENTATION=
MPLKLHSKTGGHALHQAPDMCSPRRAYIAATSSSSSRSCWAQVAA